MARVFGVRGIGGRGISGGVVLMKFGTIIQFSDGRRATVVYRGLDGEGIAWGEHRFSADQVREAMSAFSLTSDAPSDYSLPKAEALLREPWKGAYMPCVPDDYEIVEAPQ